MKVQCVEDNLPQKPKPPRPPKQPKKTLTKEQKAEILEKIGILIDCLGFGHKRFESFPELGIKNSSQIKPKIIKYIYLLMN